MADRTIVIGDVHGCSLELGRLLDAIGFTAADRLVFVGDLIARGPDTLGVLDIAQGAGAVVVRGNHEQKLLDWRAAPDTTLLSAAHAEVAHQLRPSDWALLEATPLWHALPEHNVCIVHAGLDPKLPINEQSRDALLYTRSIDATGAVQPRSGARLWGSLYMGPPHVVFGHHARERLQFHRWATGLDTGCVYGGSLTALVLAEGAHVQTSPDARRRQLVSQPAERMYFDPAHAYQRDLRPTPKRL